MLGERFLAAMQLSFSLHKDQVRKSADSVPYFSHIMSVTALVQEAGGDEDAQIAALLHDSVEDSGGEATLQLIRDQFGDSVAEIVLFCSDSVERDAKGDKLPWRERKEAHLAHLSALQPRSLTEEQRKGVLVLIADKLHNARSCYEAVLQKGDSAYEVFRGGKEGTLWYLKEMSRVLGRLSGRPYIARQLHSAAHRLHDDHATLKKIIRLMGPHVDTYYDASTPLLEKAALVQMFEDLKSDDRFTILQDDSYLHRKREELKELEELAVCLQENKVPSTLVYGAAQQVKALGRLQRECAALENQVELYAQAEQGDLEAKRQLAGSEGFASWETEWMRTTDFEGE